MSALKVLRRSLTLVAGPVVVGYLVWFLWERREQLVDVLHVGPRPFAMVAVLTLFAMLTRAGQFQVLLGALDTRISFGRAACLIMSGQLMNYLLFSPGTIMQAVILKREEALRYARFVSLWAAQVVLLLLCASVLAIVGMVFSGAPWKGGSGVMLFVLVATALGPVIILCVPKRWVASDGTLLRKLLGDVLAGWERLGGQHGRLAVVVATMLARLLLSGARLWVCFSAVGVEASLWACLVLGAVVQVTFVISFTPGGVGTRQVLVAAAAVANGLTFEQGMLASSVEHAIGILVTILMGVPSLVVVLRGRPRQPETMAPVGGSDVGELEGPRSSRKFSLFRLGGQTRERR